MIIYDEVEGPLTPVQEAAIDFAYMRLIMHQAGKNCGKARLVKMLVNQIIENKGKDNVFIPRC